MELNLQAIYDTFRTGLAGYFKLKSKEDFTLPPIEILRAAGATELGILNLMLGREIALKQIDNELLASLTQSIGDLSNLLRSAKDTVFGGGYGMPGGYSLPSSGSSRAPTSSAAIPPFMGRFVRTNDPIQPYSAPAGAVLYGERIPGQGEARYSGSELRIADGRGGSYLITGSFYALNQAVFDRGGFLEVPLAQYDNMRRSQVGIADA